MSQARIARILLVDDDARVRRVISHVLARRTDWQICGEAADGQESIEQAHATQPDLVLMDVSMPGMNGLDATRVLCREIPHVDVILVSQNDPSIISRMASEVGARAYCSKSDLSRDLLPIIERTLEVRQRNQPAGPRRAPRTPQPPNDAQSGDGHVRPSGEGESEGHREAPKEDGDRAAKLDPPLLPGSPK